MQKKPEGGVSAGLQPPTPGYEHAHGFNVFFKASLIGQSKWLGTFGWALQVLTEVQHLKTRRGRRTDPPPTS